MKAKCSNCRHWQGNKYTDYADCYRVVGTLEPDLFQFKTAVTDEWEHNVGIGFNVPFDPNDLKRDEWRYSFRIVDGKTQFFTDTYKRALRKAKCIYKVDGKYIQMPETAWCSKYEERR
jgi:hypothetical protein